MPNQSHSGILQSPWSRCQRCGRDFPLSKLVQQKGLLVCVEACYDNPIAWERERIMVEALQQPDTEMQPVEQLQKESGDENV
jgi:hypothetical protein